MVFKKSFNIAPVGLAFICLFFLQSCKKAEYVKTSAGRPEAEMFDAGIDTSTGARTVRNKVVHLYSDTVYLLNQSFVREAGEQLIIEAGTLIKVNVGVGNIAIVINAGGLITATGSADKPVVFTSNKPAATQAVNWDGIIIKGKSFNNVNGPTGIADDFSGVMKYVRVEFAPLVFEAVGSKTIVENVMVSYTNKPDFDQYQSAFSFFGGTFNARNLISYACGGPSDFYISNGYAGFMQNIIACRHPFFGKAGGNPNNSLAGIFIQNNSTPNAPNATPFTNPIISNLTVLGPNAQNGTPTAFADTTTRSGALVSTNSACFQIRNSILLGYTASGWYLNDKVVAENLQKRIVVDFNYSIVHSNSPGRLFYLAPGTADPYNSNDFKTYVLGPFFSNKSFANTADFKLKNILLFDEGPDLQPAAGSPLLTGANFAGSNTYNNDFFNKTGTHIGALGLDDWTRGWTNFRPLKTNYNFPE